MAPAHAGDPAIDTQTPRLLAAAAAFANELDALASMESKVAAAREERAAKAKALFDRMRVWFPLLVMDMSDFVASAYNGTPVVVEDLISDGQALVLTVNEHLPSLPYAEQLVADVNAAIGALQTAYKAEQAVRTLRGQQEAVEDRAAAVLNQALIAYRRMLRRTVGPAHHHYRMLRRPGRVDEDPPDGTETVTPPEATTTPSTPGNTPPVT